jgi:uncharacterized membrane protein YccC
MTYDAAAFLNSSLAILVGIAVAVVLFATFFPETPAYACHRFRRQLLVHLSYLTSACPCGPALRCYQLALFEQLGATLASVNDEPKLARECLTSALAALSAARAIGRLKSSLNAAEVVPAIANEVSRLLARLSQTLRDLASSARSSRRSLSPQRCCRTTPGAMIAMSVEWVIGS